MVSRGFGQNLREKAAPFMMFHSFLGLCCGVLFGVLVDHFLSPVHLFWVVRLVVDGVCVFVVLPFGLRATVPPVEDLVQRSGRCVR